MDAYYRSELFEVDIQIFLRNGISLEWYLCIDLDLLITISQYFIENIDIDA